MTHDEFTIGQSFWTGDGVFRCTDIGTRTILAIPISDDAAIRGWLTGPPYIMAELVFDEDDFAGCYRNAKERDEDLN